MSERTRKYLEARASGLKYKEIADMFGVSLQAVQQVCGQYNPRQFQYITEAGCVYPNLRKWMNENKVSRKEVIRRMGFADGNPQNANTFGEYMRGRCDPPKRVIDKLLEVTGLTYEVLFDKGEQE